MFEEENDETIPFFDILISRKTNDIITTGYRKSTSNDMSKVEKWDFENTKKNNCHQISKFITAYVSKMKVTINPSRK